MPPKPKKVVVLALIREWVLPAAATLGSAVRTKGILLEIRAKMAAAEKKSLDVVGSTLALRMAEGLEKQFAAASALVSKTLDGIESLPVIPREIQDILSISATERHRWLKDGRLPSIGTRTVKLRGRAKKITFHVFDPRLVEDLLDRDAVSAWREEDAATAAENRRKAAWNRSLAKAQAAAPAPIEAPDGLGEEPRPKLVGWEDFEREGLLR